MHDAFLFASIASAGILVQSCFGFAGSLTAVPLFVLFFTPREAIPAYRLVMAFMEVGLVYEARRHIQWRLIRKPLVGALLGIPVGTYALKHFPAPIIQLAVGVVTAVFALLFLFKVKVNLKENSPTQLSIGLMSGVLSGSISESGPPIVIYGLARGWDKNTFRTTLLSFFFSLAAATICSHACAGLITQRTFLYAAAAIPPAIVASSLGVWLKNQINEAHFRQGVLLLIIGVSITTLVHALRYVEAQRTVQADHAAQEQAYLPDRQERGPDAAIRSPASTPPRVQQGNRAEPASSHVIARSSL